MLVQREFYKKLPMPEEQDRNLEREMNRSPRCGNLQEIFLNNCRKNEDTLIFQLLDGTRKKGQIIGFDHHSLIIGDGAWQELVYKNNVVSIAPEREVCYIFNESRRDREEYRYR